MSKNVNIDYARLAFGHNLVLGHLPSDAVNLEQFSTILRKERSMDIGEFGLFERSTPNYTTYYPAVTAEDLKPKDEDFIHPIFRALSGVIVHKRHNPIDFGHDLDLLRKSQKLLVGQSINIDHETALGNAVGSVRSVDWEDSFTQTGIVIPAGINAEFKIDGKSNPRIARGIMMDPPSVHSTSVTVEFTWERSHPEMATEEFYNKLGTFAKDGKMIRRVVTGIRNYYEISLVGHGADPFAQKKNDQGGINNPKFAHIAYNSEEAKKVAGAYYFMDFKKIESDVVENSATEDDDTTTRPKFINSTEKLKNMKFLPLLLTTLGLQITLGEDGLTEDQENSINDALENFQATHQLDQDTITQLQEKLTAANLKVTELETASSSATEAQQFMAAEVTRLKERATSLYKSLNDAPKEAILTRIQNSNMDALSILVEQFSEQLDSKMPMTCKSCGGTEVNRASAVITPPDSKGGNTHTTLSSADAMKKLRAKPPYVARMHGITETK